MMNFLEGIKGLKLPTVIIPGILVLILAFIILRYFWYEGFSSKCFSCDAQDRAQGIPRYHGSKCFSCEAQTGVPHGTKCLDCHDD